MKLIQYESFGVPAVCPAIVAGEREGRFGYTPGDAQSISAAIRAALAKGRFEGHLPMGWQEVADRILGLTKIYAHQPSNGTCDGSTGP